MSTRRVLTFLTGLVGAVLFLAGPAPAAEGPPDDVGEVVDAYVREQVGRGVVGIQVALVRGDRVVHVAAAGDDGRGGTMTPSTPSRIESLSKSFTSMAVMQLVDSGRVDVDEPVRRYLPELRIDDPRADAITVRQLMTQTSGLADSASPDTFPEGPRTLRERVALLRDSHLVAEPGREFHYHNANYAILARTVEVVAGQRFDQYLREHVLDPLGMRDTVDTATAGSRVPGMAGGHLTAFGRGFRAAGPDYFAEGSGGVVSTARDLGRWLVAQNGDGRGPDGTRVVSARSLREMHRPQGTKDADYGFGWYRAESAEGPPVRTSHSGAGAGFGAYQGLFTESGWAVAVLVNHGSGLTAADPGVLGQNLVAAVDPSVPTLSGETHGLRTDVVLTVLLVVTLVLVGRGLARSRRWADRRRGRSLAGTAARLAVPVALAVAVAGVPSLQLRLTDRTAPWSVLFFVEPVAVVWLVAVGAGSALVVAARLWWAAWSGRVGPARESASYPEPSVSATPSA